MAVTQKENRGQVLTLEVHHSDERVLRCFSPKTKMFVTAWRASRHFCTSRCIQNITVEIFSWNWILCSSMHVTIYGMVPTISMLNVTTKIKLRSQDEPPRTPSLMKNLPCHSVTQRKCPTTTVTNSMKQMENNWRRNKCGLGFDAFPPGALWFCFLLPHKSFHFLILSESKDWKLFTMCTILCKQ